MKSAAITELKASLSEYISKVRSGEEILVTDRGKPVAKIVPLNRGNAEVPAHLAVLERAGQARVRVDGIPGEFWQRRRPRDAGGKALAAVLKDREEGR